MKNLIFLFLLLSFALHGQESDNTNRYILGGSLSVFSSNNINPESESTVSGTTFISPGSKSNNHIVGFRPYLGRQINQRSIIGVRFSTGFSLSKFRFDDEDEDSFRQFSYTIGGGLFYRYYINPKNKLKVFVQPFADISTINGESEQAAPSFEENRTINFDAGIGLGLIFSLSEKWNLLANIWSIDYRHSNFKTALKPESEISNTINANLSITNIGFGAEFSF